MQPDLPEPVVPAISRCGIRARSVQTALPEMSLPSQTDSGLAVQSPNGAMGDLTSFAALVKNVPAPFKQEFGGGAGMHIHDKFVVVDFNGDNPTVFTGSSNLAAGGENQNGDSLAMIEDEAIATMYAIEAVAMFDHYHFRKVMQTATTAQPLTLWFPGKAGAPDPWWKAYYDPTRIQMRDRYLFAGLPLPAGLAATKTVDWKAVDAAAATPAKKPSGKTSRGKTKSAKGAQGKKPARGKAAAKRKTATKKKSAPKRTRAKPKPAKKTAKPSRRKPAAARKAGTTKRGSARKSSRKRGK